MADALKRLAAQNLTPLFPHPLSVVLNHSHPPVLARLHAIKGMQGRAGA